MMTSYRGYVMLATALCGLLFFLVTLTFFSLHLLRVRLARSCDDHMMVM